MLSNAVYQKVIKITIGYSQAYVFFKNVVINLGTVLLGVKKNYNNEKETK